MLGLLRVVQCLLYLSASAVVKCQETNSRIDGFLSRLDTTNAVELQSSAEALVLTDLYDSSSQCVARNIWDVTQGVVSDLSDRQTSTDRVWASVVLFVIVAASVLSVLRGAKLVKPCLFISAALVGYYIGMSVAFQLQDWMSFDACVVPLFIGVGFGIVAGFIAVSLLDKMVFLLGAAVGIVAALMAKQIFVSFADHHDTTSSYATTLLNWYWLFAIGCGILGGCLLRVHEDRLLRIATVLVGAWGLSISLMPLLALWDVTVPSWSPLLIFFAAIVIGAVCQRSN